MQSKGLSAGAEFASERPNRFEITHSRGMDYGIVLTLSHFFFEKFLEFREESEVNEPYPPWPSAGAELVESR